MSNKLFNLDLYPNDLQFSTYLKIENKNFIYKYQQFINLSVMETLMFLFYEEREEFIFNDYKKNLRKKIIEKAEKLTFPKDTNEIHKIGTDISYYLNEEYLNIWYKYFPEMFYNNYNYVYYFQNSEIEDENLIKAAIQNKNYNNIIYLIKNHEFTFWDNLKDINFTFDSEKSFEIFDLDNILYYSKDLNIIEDVVKIADKNNYNKSKKKLIDIILQMDYNNKSDDVISIIYQMCIDNKVNLLKYLLYHPNFPNNFIHIENWNNIFLKIYDYNNEYSNYKHYEKSKIYNLIVEFIIKTISKDFLFRTLNEDIICNIVRLPNCIYILRLIFNEENLLKYKLNKKEVLISILKYGSRETYDFFKQKFDIFDIMNTSDVINNVLFNRNKSMIKDCLEYYQKKNDLEYIDLDFDFILSRGNIENKIKKLQILSKYINLKNQKVFLIRTVFNSSYFKDSKKLKYWILKKIYNNCIFKESDILNIFVNNEIENMFVGILNEKDNEMLEYFLKIINPKYNFWNLVSKCLIDYSWFDNKTNIILKYCSPLKEQCINIKKKLFLNIIQPKKILINNKNKINIPTNYYLQLIKKFEKAGLDVNNIKYQDFFQEDIQSSLYKAILYNNTELAKALIINGSEFKELYKLICTFVSWNFNEIKKWICLYNIVRRLRIKKEIKDKKTHLFKYKESIVNLETKPFRENSEKFNSLILRGGQYFYKNMDELEHMYQGNENKYIFPKHIKPHEIINITKSDIYISQKTDGLLVQDINKDYLFPEFSSEFEYTKIDGEYIKELDLYLVFGLRSFTHQHNNPYEDYITLSLEHKQCTYKNKNSYIESSSKDYVFKMLMEEAKEILDFCQKYKDRPNKWYPKKVWLISNFEDNLKILDLIEQYQNIVYDSCLYKDMSSFIEKNEIKTDGIILMKNKFKLFKYKPQRCMTADLEINNKIFRCYWEDGKWIPREERIDKSKPNPDNIVKELTYYHNNPWNINDIIKYLNETNSFQLYYQISLYNNINFKKFSKLNKTIFNNILKNNYYNERHRYLDLGSGYCNNILWKKENINIDGIEIDLSVLCNVNLGINKNIYIGDMCKKWNTKINIISDYYKDNQILKLEKKYNTIISNFSIHNIFKTSNGFYNFMKQLNIVSNEKSKLYISIIDLPDCEDIHLEDGSYIKHIKNEINYCNELKSVIKCWYKTYYSFRHIKPIKEPKIDLIEFIKLMSKYGWKFNKEFTYNQPFKLKGNWLNLMNSIKRLEFIKL